MDVYENTSAYVLNNNGTFRTNSRNGAETNIEEEAAAGTGERVIRLVVASFGLLCILQASLNVGLRQFLNMSHHNEFEEKNKLQRNYSDLQLSFNNQQKEKDELHKMYTVLQSSHAKTSEEKDQLEAELQILYSFSNNNWYYFRGSFYYGSSAELTWEESRGFCQENGADLIIINSNEEQTFIRRYNGRRWIGLSNRETEGVWKWVDGSPISLRFWNSGEPNESDHGEDCAEIIMSFTGSNWNDTPCSKTQAFICEVRVS